MEQKHKKLQWLILFWLALFIGLLIAANKLPTLTEIDQSRELNYSHGYDHYTLKLTGSWQVYQEQKQSLTLVDLNRDGTIQFTLEVGGADYFPLSKSAKMTMKAVQKKQEITFDPADIALADGAYEGIRFTGDVKKGDQNYVEEFFIYHPNEGIRLYAIYTHPQATSPAEVTAAESIIASVVFLDFEKTYEDYLY